MYKIRDRRTDRWTTDRLRYEFNKPFFSKENNCLQLYDYRNLDSDVKPKCNINRMKIKSINKKSNQ